MVAWWASGAGWGRQTLEFVHINEVAGGPETAAHLMTFDSVHGRRPRSVTAGPRRSAVDVRGGVSDSHLRQSEACGEPAPAATAGSVGSGSCAAQTGPDASIEAGDTGFRSEARDRTRPLQRKCPCRC